MKLVFGAFMPTIYSQLKKQGCVVKLDQIYEFQKDVEAIIRLECRSVITNKQSSNAFNKVYKRIEKAVSGNE